MPEGKEEWRGLINGCGVLDLEDEKHSEDENQGTYLTSLTHLTMILKAKFVTKIQI